MDYPRITIITPSFNQGQFLEETIKSILGQEYPNLEFFIIDGGSTDNSIDIIRKYESKIDYWVTEKDRGQTHAINKGMARATGDIINWINSDDLLAPGALFKVAELFRDQRIMCVCGFVTIFTEKKSWPYPPAWNAGESLLSVISRDSFNQPGTFFSKKAVDVIGYPVESLHYIMDKEWFIRFLLKFGTEPIATSTDVFALHRYHETSKTISEGARFLNEYAAIISSMAGRINESALMELLSEKYNFAGHPYRFDYSFDSLDAPVVHRMAAVLLSRRFIRIDNKNDFLFARKMRSVIKWSIIQPDDELELYYKKLEAAVKPRNWTMFRIARKFRSILN